MQPLRHPGRWRDPATQARRPPPSLRADRDPTSIEVTLSSRLGADETAQQFADWCEGLAKLGVDHIVLLTTGPWTRDDDLQVVVDAVKPLGEL